jgi:hypothetical protein
MFQKNLAFGSKVSRGATCHTHTYQDTFNIYFLMKNGCKLKEQKLMFSLFSTEKLRQEKCTLTVILVYNFH